MGNKIIYQKETSINANNREDVVAVIEVKQGLTGAAISVATVTSDNVLVITDARGNTVTCGTISSTLSAPTPCHASLTNIQGSTFGYHLSEDEYAYVQTTISSCISTVESNLVSATTSIAANSSNIANIQTTVGQIQTTVSNIETTISNIQVSVSTNATDIANLEHASLSSIAGSAEEYHVSASQYSWVTQDLRSTASPEFAGVSISTASIDRMATTLTYEYGLATPFTRLVTNSTYSLPSNIPGCFRWDSLHNTAELITSTLGTSTQLGQEEKVWCSNKSGNTIYNSQVVYLSNGSTITAHAPNISLALANSSVSSIAIGLATSDITNGTEGEVTVRGEVHGLDTSNWEAHTPLYLSALTAGCLTPNKPMPPNYAVPIGWVLESHPTDGSIYVDKTINNLLVETVDKSVAAKDPTGWLNNAGISEFYDVANRQIILTGDLRYVWRGYIVDLGSTWTSSQHPATLDQEYFLYSDDGLTFTWSTSPWEFSDLMVGYVWYGTDHQYGINEQHGIMNWQAHEEFHEVIGTYKKSGGLLENYQLDSTTVEDRKPDVTETVIKDEDIYTTVPALTTSTYTQVYLSGTLGTASFSENSSNILPLSGNRPYVNTWNGSNWTQTLISNNNYMSVWLIALPAMDDPASQEHRFQWMQGQTQGTLEEQQALFPQDLTMPIIPAIGTEYVFIAKAIIRYSSGNWRIVEVQELTGTNASQSASTSGGYLSIVSTDETIGGTGVAADPLRVSGVQNTTLISGVHTLTSLSVGHTVISNTNAVHTVWIPSSASSAFPTYSKIDFVQLGTGALSVSISGDSLHSRGNLYSLNGQYAKASLLKVTSTQWVLSGDLA